VGVEMGWNGMGRDGNITCALLYTEVGDGTGWDGMGFYDLWVALHISWGCDEMGLFNTIYQTWV